MIKVMFEKVSIKIYMDNEAWCMILSFQYGFESLSIICLWH